jgi:hypothetical protein
MTSSIYHLKIAAPWSLVLLLLLVLSTACVSKRKYSAMAEYAAQLRVDSTIMANKIATWQYLEAKTEAELVLTEVYDDKLIRALRHDLERKMDQLDSLETMLQER